MILNNVASFISTLSTHALVIDHGGQTKYATCMIILFFHRNLECILQVSKCNEFFSFQIRWVNLLRTTRTQGVGREELQKCCVIIHIFRKARKNGESNLRWHHLSDITATAMTTRPAKILE